MQLVYLDEMQDPDVLEQQSGGGLADVTQLTDKVVHALHGTTERIIVVWAYAYYRIPITRISREPSFESRDADLAPKPIVSDVSLMKDKEAKRIIGVSFNITPKKDVLDAWQCNLQTENKYFNATMGRTYTHRRNASFTVSTMREIGIAMQRLT